MKTSSICEARHCTQALADYTGLTLQTPHPTEHYHTHAFAFSLRGNASVKEEETKQEEKSKTERNEDLLGAEKELRRL